MRVNILYSLCAAHAPESVGRSLHCPEAAGHKGGHRTGYHNQPALSSLASLKTKWRRSFCKKNLFFAAKTCSFNKILDLICY